MDERASRTLRRAFRSVNPGMVVLWRLGLGRWINVWPSGSGRIMVLCHRGRVSGRSLRTPLNFAVVDGDVYCTAGFGPRTDWYRNVLADPQVEVWLPDRRWVGVAEDVSDSAERLARLREVLVASGFAAPLAGVPVRRLSDPDLAARTADYRLLRIRRTGKATGRPAPADLGWVWAVLGAGAVVLTVVGRRRAGRRRDGCRRVGR